MKKLLSFRCPATLAPVGIACLLTACTPIPYIDLAEDPLPVMPPATNVIVEAPPPPPPPVPQAEPAPAAPMRTAILLSDDIPEFSSIAREIELRTDSEHLTVYNLDGNLANVSRIKAEAAGVDQVIAIGLLAATVGRDIDSKRMVFCQVFNYGDYDLISEKSKGVSLLPPFDLQIQRWTELAPELRRVGIIIGPAQDDLISEIRIATESHGIALEVREVASDKEALYAFKRITPDIQGLWLVPDNRILSPEVVREIMSYSARHLKHVLVFGNNLLGVGGLLSFTSDPGDVAEQVLAQLEQVSAGGTLAGPAMRPLTQLEIEINSDIARHLGLEISEQDLRAANKD